jgi:hypothetical protein
VSPIFISGATRPASALPEGLAVERDAVRRMQQKAYDVTSAGKRGGAQSAAGGGQRGAAATQRELEAAHAELRVQSAELARWNKTLEEGAAAQLGELERMSRLKRFLAPSLAELIVSSGDESISRAIAAI